MSLQRHAGAVRLFAQAMRFANWLQGLPGRITPAPFRLVQIGSAYWHSRALYVAASLDIATQLGDDSLSAAELAARVGADADGLARLLRLLAALGVFAESAPRVFRNNRLSRHLAGDHPQSVRSMVLLHNSPDFSRPWYDQLEAGIRSGTPPFRLSHGSDLFDYLDRHAEFDRLFAAAMDSVEALTGDSFASDFAWERFSRVIDVGGSRGSKAMAILRRHPTLQALVFDRPPVIAEARAYWAQHGGAGSERLHFAAGDLFAGIPPARDAADLYLLAAVLHGFADADCVRALEVLRRAIGSSGARAALLELVLPETGADPASAAFDLQMLVGSSGRERTLGEWKNLIEQAGLRLEEVVALRSLGSLLVLRTATP